MLFVSRSNASDTNQQKRGHFVIYEVTVMVNYPPLDARMDVRDNSSKEIKLVRIQCVGEELHQDGDINHCNVFPDLGLALSKSDQLF